MNLRQQLVEQHGRLYRLAFSWCHNKHLAEDLAQETLTKGLKNLHQLREHNKLRGWLSHILVNCWRDYLRLYRELDDVDTCVLEDADTPEKIQVRQNLSDAVRRAIATLPQGQRMVITLVDLEECSYAEVADILEIPVGTVMSRLCRARRLLADRLLAHESDSSDNNIRNLR